MDLDVRTELDKLHERVSDLKERLVTLEAQGPHIQAALSRIEKMIEKVNGHLTRGVWIIIGAIIMSIMAFALGGGLKLH